MGTNLSGKSVPPSMKASILRPLLRGMARLALITLGLFVVLAVSACLLAYIFQDNLLNYYRRQLERAFNMDIRYRKAQLSGLTLQVEGLQLQTRGGESLARVEKAQATLHPWWGLKFGGERWIDGASLQGASLNVQYSAEGRLNWSSVTVPRRLAQAPLEHHFRGHFLIQDGEVRYQDLRQGDFVAHLDGIRAGLDVLAEGNWKLISRSPGLDLKAQGGSAQAQIDMGLKKFPLDDWLLHPLLESLIRAKGASANGRLQLRVPLRDPARTLALGQLQLKAAEVSEPHLRQPLHQADVQLKILGSSLEVQRAQATFLGIPLQSEGRLQIPQAEDPSFQLHLVAGPAQLGALTKLLKGAPQATGSVTVDLLAEGNPEELSLKGRVTANHIQAMQQSLKDLVADFELDRDALHLRKVVAHDAQGEEFQAHGWVFQGGKDGHKLFLKLKGGGARLGQLSPWLAGAQDLEVTALGSLSDPVLTGQATLQSLPGNAAGLAGGHSHFWLDRQSAFLWDAQLWGSGGQVQVPAAVVDYRQGQLAAAVTTQGYDLQGSHLRGGGHLSGDYVHGQFSGVGWLDESQFRVPGLPAVDHVRGLVAYDRGELLIPRLEMQHGGDCLALTGSWRDGAGSFWAQSDQLNLSQYLALAPQGPRNLMAVAHLQGHQLEAFRVASQGGNGDLYAVGRWLDGRAPELYAQFSHLQWMAQTSPLQGELATAWQDGHLNYFYDASPVGDPQKLLAGQGWIEGSRIHLRDNYLLLPASAPVQFVQGEGRAYSYFGPSEGPPLQHHSMAAPPWSQGGSLACQGLLDLSRRQLDLQLRGRNLNLSQISTWFGPLTPPEWWQQYGLSLQDMVVDGQGRIQGPWASPRLEGSLSSSWTRLERQFHPGQRESLAVSWRADAHLRQGKLELLGLLSPHPQDYQLLAWKGPRQSPPEQDWLRSRISLAPNLTGQGWVRAEAFPLSVARWLTPPWLSAQLPSGSLAMPGQGLRLSGSIWEPQLAGRVDLKQGRFWTGLSYLPIDEAFVDFASRKGATAISRFHLRSAGLSLEGRGNRTSDGSLTAQLWADDLPLTTLENFGWNLSGWKGTVDLAMSFRDARGVDPAGWLALEGQNLVSPDNQVFGVKRLVLGQVDRELGGIPYTGPGKGVGFRLEAGQVVVDLPPSSTEISWDNPAQSRMAAQGQVSWRSAPRSDESLMSWLTSKNGPRFGKDSHPLQIEVDHLGWNLAHQLLGLPKDGRDGILSGSLQLLGQFYAQHHGVPQHLPLAQLQLKDLLVEGPGSSWSGVKLSRPTQIAYQINPGAGWVHLAPTALEFFRKTASDAPALAQGTLEMAGDLVVAERAGLKKTPPGEQQLQLHLSNLPVQNLAFLAPQIHHWGGLIKDVTLRHTGSLTQPQAELTLQAQDLQVQGLNVTSAQGRVTLASEGPGKVRLNFGEGKDELRFLLGAENDLTQALRFQGQALLDFDRLIQMPRGSSGTPLVGIWQGWNLTDRSEFALKAQLHDSQLRLLSGLAPEGSVLSGTLNAGLELQGTSAKPELTGTLALENGSFSHPHLRSPLAGLNLLARFDRIAVEDAEPGPALSSLADRQLGRYTLEKLEGTLGGQSFQGKGKAELVGLQPTFLDVHFDGDQLPIHWDGLMDGKADIHLNLKGLSQEGSSRLFPTLLGQVSLPQADFSLPDEEQLAQFMQWAPTRALGKGLGFGYNVDLRLGEDCWFGFLNSSVRGTGDLKIAPSLALGTPALRGSLFLSRGIIRIPVYEVNFRVRQGYAIFEDDWVPRLENLEADSTLGSYQISARFDGKYPDLRAELVSNPPLPDSDLRRLVGLGGLPSSGTSPIVSDTLNPSGNRFLVNQGVTFLSNLVAGSLTQGLGRLLFMSEVSFDILPTAEYVVRLAKSLDDRDRFLLTFAQVIGTTRFNQTLSQYGFEWRFQPNLLTRLTLDNYGQARIWFQGVLRF